MLELIQEITTADIEPARLVHATTELCEGVEASLIDLDVSSIQVGELEVKVKPLEVDLEDGADSTLSCDVIHVKETCNLKEANVSITTIAKSQLQVRFAVGGNKHGGPILNMVAHSDNIVAVQQSTILVFDKDGALERKVNHPFLENARAITKLHNDHLAVVCGGRKWSDAKIIVFSAEVQYKGVLTDGDYCDASVVGKKMYALSNAKPKISIFATNSYNKWVVTGSIALDGAERHVLDSIATTGVSVLVGYYRSGRIQEFTLTGEAMNDLTLPVKKQDGGGGSAHLRLGPADYAGALMCARKGGALMTLDAHRKWIDIPLPEKYEVINALAMDEKGAILLSTEDSLVSLLPGHAN